MPVVEGSPTQVDKQRKCGHVQAVRGGGLVTARQRRQTRHSIGLRAGREIDAGSNKILEVYQLKHGLFEAIKTIGNWLSEASDPRSFGR